MFRFSCLDKVQKDKWLPILFDLLYQNMRSVAPDERSYEVQKAAWTHEISTAIDKAPRQIILCLDDDVLAGYIQYYIRDHLLMVEEFQLEGKYQHTFLFYISCRYLLSILPKELEKIEAYADKRNRYSISLMEKLGMMPCEDIGNTPFVHMAGSLQQIRLWHYRNILDLP